MSYQKRDSFIIFLRGIEPLLRLLLPFPPLPLPTPTASSISSLSNLIYTNHFLWKSHFLAIFRTHDLLGYIYGTNVCPETLLNDKESIPNPTDLL